MATGEQAPADSDMEILTDDQCRRLLGTRSIGRIAFPLGGDTEVFPVNYSTDGEIVIFRTAPGTKLAEAPATRVAFEVDDWDTEARIGWSVVLKGVAQEVTSGADPFSAALRSRNVEPLAPGEHEHWIAIYPAMITGRRFHRMA